MEDLAKESEAAIARLKREVVLQRPIEPTDLLATPGWAEVLRELHARPALRVGELTSLSDARRLTQSAPDARSACEQPVIDNHSRCDFLINCT